MKISSVYGNASCGEHPAIFIGVESARYPKGARDIFGFLVLKEDQSAPLQNDDGDPQKYQTGHFSILEFTPYEFNVRFHLFQKER